ncbi:MAG: XdhC family protein [Candidatus Hodarchaeales archaeon]|jgi:xanthine dehydrogenase accessory factor
MQKDFFEIIREQYQKGGTFSLVTVVDISGSAPQRVGAKMLVSPTGELLCGTIGGGSIENLALKDALKQINTKTPILKEYKLLEEGEKAIGSLCGGTMTLFYDILGSGAKIYIFGAGHISQQLTPLLASLGFWIVVIDDRKDYLNEKFKHSKVVETLSGNFIETIDSIEFDAESYIVILTYSHNQDEKILKHLLTKRQEELGTWKYLGMIGSKRKVKEVFNRLISQGIDPSLLEKVRSPIGLAIGSQTPEEVAISIAAEIIRVRNTKE